MVADAHSRNWVDRFAPDWLKPYAPAGALWTDRFRCCCCSGRAPSAGPGHARQKQAAGFDLRALLLFLVGSVLMRGAGAHFNDIVDTDIDVKVARTRSQPNSSGQVTRLQRRRSSRCNRSPGWLCSSNGTESWLGMASLVLVAIYPLVERIHLVAAAVPGARLQLACSAGPRRPARSPCRRCCSMPGLLDHRLRHHLRAAGHRGRRADRVSPRRGCCARVRPIVAVFYAATLALSAGGRARSGGSLIFCFSSPPQSSPGRCHAEAGQRPGCPGEILRQPLGGHHPHPGPARRGAAALAWRSTTLTFPS